MRELRLVTVEADGSRLVLAGEGTEQFVLPVTDALRSAIRPDRGRPGQLEIALESQLTPKEIQTRIRHGETAEDVARAAGVPVDRVRRFEGAVLAERAHIADLARRSGLRRADPANGGIPLLEDAVHSRLSARDLDTEALRWDAWRRDDGRWTVEVTFRAGGGDKRGRFTYDTTARASVPADDDGRWLAGEERGRGETAAVRGPRLVPVDDTPTDPPDLDEAPRTDPAPSGLSAVPRRPDADDGAETHAAGSHAHPDDADAGAAQPADGAEPEEAARKSGARRNRRSSVPSWDEIVFGRRRE